MKLDTEVRFGSHVRHPIGIAKILNFIHQKICTCKKMTNMRYAAAYQSFTAIESCKKKSRTNCAACVWFQSLYGPSRAKVLPSRPATVCETLAYFCQKMRLSYAKFLAARYLELLFRAFLLNPTATQVFAMHAQLGSSWFVARKMRSTKSPERNTSYMGPTPDANFS